MIVLTKKEFTFLPTMYRAVCVDKNYVCSFWFKNTFSWRFLEDQFSEPTVTLAIILVVLKSSGLLYLNYVATTTAQLLFRIYRPTLCWQKSGLFIWVPKWVFESAWFQFPVNFRRVVLPAHSSISNKLGSLMRSELLIDHSVDKKTLQLFINAVHHQVCWQKFSLSILIQNNNLNQYGFVNNSPPWKHYPEINYIYCQQYR